MCERERVRESAHAKRACGYRTISIGWGNVVNVGQPFSQRLRRFGLHVSRFYVEIGERICADIVCPHYYTW